MSVDQPALPLEHQLWEVTVDVIVADTGPKSQVNGQLTAAWGRRGIPTGPKPVFGSRSHRLHQLVPTTLGSRASAWTGVR